MGAGSVHYHSQIPHRLAPWGHCLPFYWLYRGLIISWMEVSLSRIARAQSHTWKDQDRQYAQKQLRKIYSEELARVMREKKFYLINQANRERIDTRIQRFYQEKITKLTRMMQQSHQRKEKLINDRVKACESSDKRWFQKKEDIKIRVRQQEQSMVEVAKGYRLKSETFWKEREANERQHLRDFSAKYHRLYNSNAPASPSPSATVVSFDQQKLNSLLEKRSTRHQGFTTPKRLLNDSPQERERSLRTLQSEAKLQKLIQKLNRAQLTSTKREELKKKESLQRARMKLSQKVYRNNKPQIGQDCTKHSRHHQHFRSRTLAQQSPSPPSRSPQNRATLSRSSSVCLKNNKQQRERREQCLLRYYQKTRRLKLTKQLKLNVRSVLNNQLRDKLLRKES